MVIWRFADLQCGDVVGQFVTDGRLDVHHVVFPEQVSQLLLVFIDHLDYSADKEEEEEEALLLEHRVNDSDSLCALSERSIQPKEGILHLSTSRMVLV